MMESLKIVEINLLLQYILTIILKVAIAIPKGYHISGLNHLFEISMLLI